MNFIKKIIEYGLYLLVFLLPIQTRWIIKAGELHGGYFEYGTYSLYLTDIILLILLGLFLFFKGRNWKLEPIWYIIAVLELIIFFSVFIAPDRALAFFVYLRFLLGIGLFWLIINFSFDKIKLIYALIGSVLLQSLLGIWQFFAQSSFASKWLGMSQHNPADLGASVVETIDGARRLRAYGGLDHPNMLGGMIAICLLFIIYIIIKQARNDKRNYKLYFIYTILTAALFFTFSRAAWAGAAIGIAIWLLMAWMQKRYLEQREILRAVLLMGVLMFCLFNIYNDLVMTRFSTDTRLEKKSSQERIEAIEISGAIVREAWFSGVGIGNYTKYVEKEVVKGKAGWFYQPVHNVWLLVLSEIGIIGFLAFLGIFVFKIVECTKKESFHNNFQLATVMSLGTMFLVDHWWWSLHFGVLFLWFLLGVLYKKA